MKKIKLLLIILCFLTPFYTSANIDTNDDDSDLLTEINEQFADKSFAEIKKELQDGLLQLESFTPTDFVGFSIRTTSSDTPKYTDLMQFPDAKTIQSTFNAYLDTVSFSQRIYGDKSNLYLSISDSDLTKQLNGYNNYNFESSTFLVTKAYFKDGSSIDIDKDSEYINSNKQITALELIAEYRIPQEPVTKLHFSDDSDKEQNSISLTSIKGDDVIFTVPQSLSDAILNVEGLDVQGRALASSGSSSYTFNIDEINHIKHFMQKLLEHIDNNEITDKEELIQYMSQNYSELKQGNTNSEKTTIMRYTYQGDITSINIYLQPKTETIRYQTKLTQAKAQYNDGLIIAHDKGNKKEGIINEQGEWIIEPIYVDIYHEVDNYYMISDSDRNEKTLYLVDKKNKALKKQPFYIMNNKIYQDRFIIINRDRYNNYIKGLLDIQTKEIILPVEYNSIQITENFYITDQYDEKHDEHYREVYNSQNDHKVYSGDATIIIDKNNFITKTEICSEKELDDYDYYSYSFSPQKIERYCYAQYSLHDITGKKLNDKPYRKITDEFSDNLLLVSDKKKQFFVNRQAQQLNIDLDSYKKIDSFSQGLAAVRCDSNGLYGYIDPHGKRVIPCIYQSAKHFQGGSAMVEYNGKYQLIKPDNSVIRVFNDRLRSWNNRQGNLEASYIFYDSTVYNHKGELISKPDED